MSFEIGRQDPAATATSAAVSDRIRWTFLTAHQLAESIVYLTTHKVMLGKSDGTYRRRMTLGSVKVQRSTADVAIVRLRYVYKC